MKGLEIGERVVVKGQRSLKHGSAIKVIDDAGAGEATQAKSDSGAGS
jgi:hypothetical protein